MGRRRCKSIILEDYKLEIEEYCKRNMLSVDKIYHSSICSNDVEGRLWIMGEGDPSRGYLGMLDTVPLPTTLEIYLESGKLRFVQTEHTHELRADCADRVPVPQMAFA
jgi:hypothetical protein